MVRLRPVMLTAVTTVLGLIPIAIGMDIDFYRWPRVIVLGSAGGAFWLPMALATIYGLSVATILTLVVVPVLYMSAERGKIWLAELPQRLRNRLGRSRPRLSGTPAPSERSGD